MTSVSVLFRALTFLGLRSRGLIFGHSLHRSRGANVVKVSMAWRSFGEEQSGLGLRLEGEGLGLEAWLVRQCGFRGLELRV